jgi:hypothetical protein
MGSKDVIFSKIYDLDRSYTLTQKVTNKVS